MNAMLDLDSRLKLLDEELQKVTSEQLHKELMGYEAKGPPATKFTLLKVASKLEPLFDNSSKE
jgi:hypothetical protein